jgi:DNA-binding winged helix-turn-helix (wHTH) protein
MWYPFLARKGWKKDRAVPESSSLPTDALRAGNRVVALGIAAIVVILLAAALFLFLNLPDANVYNAKIEQIFVENDLTTATEINALEVLAQSGTTFAEVLQSYRFIIFVLLVFATALLVAALVFLVMLIELNRRISRIQRAGIQVATMLISREGRAVYINDMEFQLTEAALETLAVLAEARMDDDVLTGAQIEAVISGRNEADCDEAAGATRIKRLRDALGNQMVSELLVKTIARRGYALSVPKEALKIV